MPHGELRYFMELARNSSARPAFADDSRSFANGDQLIGGDASVLFVKTIRPIDVDVDGGVSTESEV